MTNYVVATIKSWNIEGFHELTPALSGQWHLITNKDDLTLEKLEVLKPRYIFFPHWSWIVPDEILERYECVCFHMTDLPYGRGGSPLQNLIARGHKNTKLTALRMSNVLDGGDIYTKQDLSLEGTAADILARAGRMSFNIMKDIAQNEPKPAPQEGEPTVFTRRTPEMSALPEEASLETLYDHIRMLDGEGYPPAFIEHGDARLSFSKAELTKDGALMAQVEIKMKDKS